MHSCEQNSFFCFCVCQRNFSGNSVESHHAHGAAAAAVVGVVCFFGSLSFVLGRPGPLNLTVSAEDIFCHFISFALFLWLFTEYSIRYASKCLRFGFTLHLS